MLTGDRHGLATELLRQPQRARDALPFLLRPAMERRGLDEDRHPLAAAPGCAPPRHADEARRERPVAHADHHPLADGPRAGDRVRLHVRLHLVVDALGRSASSRRAVRFPGLN